MQTQVSQAESFYKLWTWFETNKKQVTWGGSIVVVVALIAVFFLWHQSEKEVTASEALSSVSIPQAGSQPARADAYLKVAANYPNSSAGSRALLLAAGSLFVDGKFSEAQAQFERFIREHRGSPYTGQALLGRAASLDAQGKTNDAIVAYKELVDRHANENVLSQARFSLANLYEGQNKPDLARPLFEDIARAEPYSSIGSEAGMRLEELKIRHPTLFQPPVLPTTPAPTNAIPLQLEK